MESIKSHQRWHHTLNLFHWWLYVIRFSFISIVISGIKSIWDPLLREQDKENRNQTQKVYPWHQRTTAKNAFCCTSHKSSLNPSEINLIEWWQCANNVSCTAVSRLIFCQWKTLYNASTILVPAQPIATFYIMMHNKSFSESFSTKNKLSLSSGSYFAYFPYFFRSIEWSILSWIKNDFPEYENSLFELIFEKRVHNWKIGRCLLFSQLFFGKQIWTCNKLKVTGVHGQVSVNCAFSENFIFASDFHVQHFEEQKTSRYKYGKIWFLGAAIHLLEHLYTVCVKHELLSNLWHQPQLSRFIANSK